VGRGSYNLAMHRVRVTFCRDKKLSLTLIYPTHPSTGGGGFYPTHPAPSVMLL